MNYKLIYDVRKSNLKTDSLSNLEAQFCNKARDEARALHKKYTDFIEKFLGHTNFEVTNEFCIADGIIGHVYSPTTAPRGVGRRKCIFCEIDDMDI